MGGSGVDGDSDSIVSNDDLWSLIVGGIAGVNFKMAILIFIIFILISSTTFITRILSEFGGAVNLKTPTTYGVILQGMFLCIAFLIIDSLSRMEII